MPSRFDKYRVKDGRTRLGEAFFNPVFQDIDLRLVGLEDLRLSWEETVRAVADYGLARINDALGPAFAAVTATSAEVEAARLAAVAALEQLETAVANIEADAWSDIDAWKAARLAELDAWRASLTAELPVIEGRLEALEAGLPTKADAGTTAAALASKADAAATTASLATKASQTDLTATVNKLPLLVQPDDLGNFTIAAGLVDGHLAAVASYGLYRYDSASTELADGETVLEPTGGVGRWLLAAPHWDFVWAYLAGLLDDHQGEIETAQATANAALPASKLLAGSASLDFASIAASASATLTITVAGAATTDRVLLTPPSTLPNGLIPIAYVSAADTVSVRLNNVTAAPIDPAAMTFLVTVFKP